MFLPPPGVKIRRTIETLFLRGTATLIAERDPKRVLLSVLLDESVTMNAAFAGSSVGLDTLVVNTAAYGSQYWFWGPEEVWALCTFPASPDGGNILVQSVFYD